MNFLEQLAAEWYEYSGFFVRTNVLCRKLIAGGWGGELDVLALKPKDGLLLHVETSGDASPWSKRWDRLRKKKFVLSLDEYSDIVGMKVKRLEKLAIVGWSKRACPKLDDTGDFQILSAPEFLRKIVTGLECKKFGKEAVPESYPLLRTIQVVLCFNLQVPTRSSG